MMFTLTFARLELGFESESASVLADVGSYQMASGLQTSGTAEKSLHVASQAGASWCKMVLLLI